MGTGGNIGDVYEKGRMMYPPLVFRLTVPGDHVPDGFSNSTLPLLLFKSFESNYHEVLMAVLGQIFHWHQQSAVDSGVTFVVSFLPPSYHYVAVSRSRTCTVQQGNRGLPQNEQRRHRSLQDLDDGQSADV